MSRNTLTTLTLVAAAVAAAGSLTYTPVAEAFNFGDMMNPSRWMGGKNRNRDYDRDRYDGDAYYDDGPYGGRGWGGGPGYGYGGPGYGGYGAPGYGGYGAPGYGGYGAPGYGAPAYGAPAPAAPATPAAAPSKGSAGEIEALKRRIEELESSQRPAGPSAPASNDWPSAPAFRPMSKY